MENYSGKVLSQAPASLEQLPASLQRIARALEPMERTSPATIRKVIEEAGVHPDDLQPWADLDHPQADSYGRKLVYHGGHFEIMAMSWYPGDVSGIHDHGYTQWGAVQVFGPAEHATFRIEEGVMHTASRGFLKPFQVIGVSHDLVHQMGNTTDKPFFTLHVYGLERDIDNVTGDARVFDLLNEKIQRVDGGVFYALPPSGFKRLEAGPRGDCPTRMRFLVELARRLQKMDDAEQAVRSESLEEVVDLIFSADKAYKLFYFLDQITDEDGHQTDSAAWNILNWELKEVARFQDAWLKDHRGADQFHQYAEWYDDLIGKPCLDGFMANYLRFFQDHYGIHFSRQQVLSLGCGTGLTEDFMVRELGVPHKQLLGIDVSEAMLAVANRRIQARPGDIFQLSPEETGVWDVVFSGLNVFHYLDHNRFDEAIRRAASVVKPGGFFIGDFITPDHIRWYPNVMYSDDKKTISLRTPTLREEEGHIFQQSEIVNIRFEEEKMRVSYAGKHLRFLPPLHRVRSYFEAAFDKVDLFDAVTLAPIPDTADSCASTRYLVVARK